jgi:hypothetical protein
MRDWCWGLIRRRIWLVLVVRVGYLAYTWISQLTKAQSLDAAASNIVFSPPHDIQTPLKFPIIPASSGQGIQPHTFNSIFSNATLHWCNTSPAAVLDLCRSLLVQDGTGKLAVEMGGGMNMIGVRAALWQAVRERGRDPAALDPWYFPRVEEYRRVSTGVSVMYSVTDIGLKLLIAAGFEPLSIELYPRPTQLPTSLYGWLQTFARSSFLASFDDAEAEAIMRQVEAACAPDCRYEEMDDETGEVKERWEVMYVRLRFVAVLKPDSREE